MADPELLSLVSCAGWQVLQSQGALGETFPGKKACMHPGMPWLKSTLEMASDLRGENILRSAAVTLLCSEGGSFSFCHIVLEAWSFLRSSWMHGFQNEAEPCIGRRHVYTPDQLTYKKVLVVRKMPGYGIYTERWVLQEKQGRDTMEEGGALL